MTKEKPRTVRLDWELRPGGHDEKLVDYLEGLERMSRRDAMLQAVRSYWLPLAILNADVPRKESEIFGVNAVADLVRQAREICMALELDASQFVGLLVGRAVPVQMMPYLGTGEVPTVTPGMPVPPAATPTSATSATSAPASLQSDDGGKSEEKKKPWGNMSDGFAEFDRFPVNPVDE